MKKYLVFGLTALMLLSLFTGCKAKDRILYAKANLSKAVELADYKGLEVKTSSAEVQELYAEELESDVEAKELYNKKTEGAVAEGDIANIDYVGKKDGVAFEGGTASGYDLTIGSNTFIDGFESGIIDKEIGTTFDLNLTFPENYGNTDLAGKEVVFTVTVNYVKQPQSPEEGYEKAGFSSVEKYEADLTKRAVKNYLLQQIIKASKVKDYPEEDAELLCEAYLKMAESEMQSQGISLETYLSYMGQTMEQFENTVIEEQVKPTMDNQMPIYAIMDEEEIAITDKEIDDKIKQLLKETGSTTLSKEDFIEYFGYYYFENIVATEKVMDVLYENAKISE